jgi:Zn-dependent protease
MNVSSGVGKENLRAIPLGHVFGIPIGVHYSWFTILVLLTWVLAVGYYPAEFQGCPSVATWIVSALTAILLFVAVLLHELGHAVVALHYQLPVRGITLLVFGGVAQVDEEPPSPVAEFWIAFAGPLVSFALAAALGLLQPFLSGSAPLLALVKYLIYINGTLAVFNLMPGFPLDGGRIVRAVIWAASGDLQRASLVAANLGRGVSFLFIVLGVWQIVVGNFGTGLWIALIGWFLETAARAEVRRQEILGLLAGHYASEAINPDHAAIAAGSTLQQLVDCSVLATGQRNFMIEGDGRTVGLLTLHRIQRVPRSDWPTTPVAQIMLPASQIKSVEPDCELWTALQEMEREGVTQLPVMADGQILGMLTRKGIMRFLRTLRELATQS